MYILSHLLITLTFGTKHPTKMTESKFNKKQIIVTGGAGYIGSVLVPMLLEEGYLIHILDRFYFGYDSLSSVRNHPHLKVTNIDIFHHENILQLFNNVEAIVHLASISNDPSGDLDPNLTIQTNFLATMSLARRAKSVNVKQFIFISSCSVYGARGNALLNEKSPTAPATLYALSKLQCEDELLPLANEEFNVTILRFATNFGYSPRMRFDLAVNAMAKSALLGKHIIINGDGKQYRPFIHVKDAARAIIQILKANCKKTNKKIYNVGDNRLNYTIRDLGLAVQSFFPDVRLEHIDHNKDSRSYRVAFDSFRETFDFHAQYSIEDCLAEVQKMYQNEMIIDMNNENYYNLEVMKRTIREPVINYSLASSPRWYIEGIPIVTD